jgi:hypothetical protein
MREIEGALPGERIHVRILSNRFLPQADKFQYSPPNNFEHAGAKKETAITKYNL